MKATKTLGPKTSLLFTKLHDQDRLVFDLNTAARLMEEEVFTTLSPSKWGASIFILPIDTR